MRNTIIPTNTRVDFDGKHWRLVFVNALKYRVRISCLSFFVIISGALLWNNLWIHFNIYKFLFFLFINFSAERVQGTGVSPLYTVYTFVLMSVWSLKLESQLTTRVNPYLKHYYTFSRKIDANCEYQVTNLGTDANILETSWFRLKDGEKRRAVWTWWM